jgi:hypothetical protein
LLQQLFLDIFGDNMSVELDRPNKARNWKIVYPKAVIPDDLPEMRTKGYYEDMCPKGAVVHFTAGWNNKTPESSMTSGLNNGYCYLTILADGTVVQNFDLARWGYHAGSSKWEGLGSGISNKCVGIEVCCGGRLSKKGDVWKTWFNKTVPESERRWVEKKDNILHDGMYEKYTEAQEKSLIEFLLWMHENYSDIFKLDYVVGHDSIAPKRKNDPGGSLSMTMPEFRALLKSKAGEVPTKPLDEVILPPSNPHLWNPDTFFMKIDNLLANPTPARIADMRDIVMPSAKKKILSLLQKVKELS